MRKIIFTFLFACLVAFQAQAHCQIPCGIYGDSLQIALLYEDIATIEKSMNSIVTLSAQADRDYNQLVRWVENKGLHADKIQDVVAYYFMTQRLTVVDESNPAYKKYVAQLVLLNQMQQYAMKAKQTTDLSYVKKLRDALHAFEHLYFGH